MNTPTEETPKAGDPPKEETPPAEFTPLTADDLKFPEGLEVDETMRDDFLSIFNDREKTPAEQAQAFIDLQLKAAQAASEGNSTAWSNMQTEWQTAVRADEEVGGDKLQPALASIGKLITEHGSDELRQVLDFTGAGNNVHVIKFLNKLADKLVEGGPVQGAPTSRPGDAASRMFPSMKG